MSLPITIAGGGLAGLALGIALRTRGIEVTLHEAGSYPRHRVCGEFISGVEDETLAVLGIEKTLGEALCLRSTSWWRKGRNILMRDLPEPARGISRHQLDQRLAEQFESLGGALHQRSRIQLGRGTEGLVYATGRVRHRGSRWMGLKAHVCSLAMDADLEMHLGRGSYLGISRIEGGRVNVCGLFEKRRGLASRGSETLLAYLRAARLGELAERLRDADIDESSFLGVSDFHLGRQPSGSGEGRRCAIGDAERMIPPFTGNGMSMALEAAAAALDPLLAFAHREMLWEQAMRAIEDALVSRFEMRCRWADLLHPLLLSSAGSATLAVAGRAHLLPFPQLFRALRSP